MRLNFLSFMAATSHDYWQQFLGPRGWKALHMTVYAAYGLVVMHIAPFGEKLATYRLRLRDGMLELDPRPLAPGTPAALTLPGP